MRDLREGVTVHATLREWVRVKDGDGVTGSVRDRVGDEQVGLPVGGVGVVLRVKEREGGEGVQEPGPVSVIEGEREGVAVLRVGDTVRGVKVGKGVGVMVLVAVGVMEVGVAPLSVTVRVREGPGGVGLKLALAEGLTEGGLREGEGDREPVEERLGEAVGLGVNWVVLE